MAYIKLPPSERPKVMTEISVSGNGIFPLDMLRYDSCWPSSQYDVVRISQKDFRTINLTKFGEWWTSGRWESFGWKVTHKSVGVET